MAHGTTALYRDLLGARWDLLPPAIKRLHTMVAPHEIRGTFRVQSRLLGRVFGMPRAGERVPVTLTIQPVAGAEIWTRRFAEQTLVSRVAKTASGVLLERIGILDLMFDLQLCDGRLVHRQIDARLNVCGRSLRLPSCLRPRVHGVEQLVEPDTVHVSVEVRWPCSRLLLAYEGKVDFTAKHTA